MEIYRICRMAKRRETTSVNAFLRNTVNNETSIRRNNRIEDAPHYHAGRREEGEAQVKCYPFTA
jgi:hypothetical protein